MTQEKQKAILAGIDTGEYDLEHSLEELAELAKTAGAEVIGIFTQNRTGAENATFIGGGKLREIAEYAAQREAELLIFDGELSGTQLRNISDITGLDVIDRTTLILDIFAGRATSAEGKLQVELAQQKYRLPQLIGAGSVLSRQGGGIGTRGPGETKLETDRRYIRRRIHALESQLREMEKRRGVMRRKREKSGVPVIAIVGYTNVGKSTLLNLLTGAEIYTQDQLFATLDPTARELRLPDGQKSVIIDTVGLIDRLPHGLVEAFHSTLEVAAEADVILTVCDYASPHCREQLAVTEQVLDELGCGDIPKITVFNKIDLVPDSAAAAESIPVKDVRHVFISAAEEKGIDLLLRQIAECLSDSVSRVRLLIPYTEGGLLDSFRREGNITEESYTENGTLITGTVPKRSLYKYQAYGSDQLEG